MRHDTRQKILFIYLTLNEKQFAMRSLIGALHEEGAHGLRLTFETVETDGFVVEFHSYDKINRTPESLYGRYFAKVFYGFDPMVTVNSRTLEFINTREKPEVIGKWLDNFLIGLTDTLSIRQKQNLQRYSTSGSESAQSPQPLERKPGSDSVALKSFQIFISSSSPHQE